MNDILDEICELLESDMVYYGQIARCVDSQDNSSVSQLIHALLCDRNVEIGSVRLRDREYVEFVGWIGTINERIQRATRTVQATEPQDREFVYWLCLRKNVDRFEDAA